MGCLGTPVEETYKILKNISLSENCLIVLMKPETRQRWKETIKLEGSPINRQKTLLQACTTPASKDVSGNTLEPLG